MSIDRGYGIATSAVIADSYDLDALIADTEAAKAAALAAQVAAEAAQTAAELAETNAETAETNAETAETNAETAETNAETAETNAETAETNAETAETNASASATAAASSASSAAIVNTNVNTKYDNFDDRFLGTKSSDPSLDNDSDALLEGAMYYNSTDNDIRFYNGSSWDAPATDAATSETNAASSATSAASSATSAASSATSATSSATSATSSASTATTQASAASTSATNASTSASTATTQASAASTSATGAASSATSASTAQTAAETAQTAAETAQTAAEAALDNFDDVYLGAKASDPTLDNDGDALTAGDMYFNTASDSMKVYDGSAWGNVALSASTVVSKTSSTGSAELPSGTTAQRDGTPSAGYLRWNTTDTSAEVYDGSSWAAVGGGNSTTEGLYEHAHTISADYSITSGNNALTAGPITIDSGYSVTIPTGSTWVVA